MSVIGKNSPFYLPVKILKSLKMLSSREGGYSPVIQHVLIFLIFFSICMFTTGFHLYKLIKDDIKEIDVSEDIFLIAGGTTVAITNLSFLTLHQEWMKFLLHLTYFKKYGEPDTFSNTKNWCNIFFKIWLGIFTLYLVIYPISIHLESPKCYEIQEKLKLDQLVCGMYFPIWITFPVPKFMITILYFIQMTVLYVCTIGCVMVVYLYLESVAILKCHVDHLNNIFRRIMFDENRRKRRSNMKLWVQYHNHVIWLTNHFSRLVRRTYSYTVYVSAISIGLCTYNLETSTSVKGIVCLFGWIMAYFLFCLAGQVVIYMGESITDNICNSVWYKTEIATMKDLSFILMMSQKLIYVTVFPNGVIGLQLFIKIIQASYSYLTVLGNLVRSP